MDKSKKVTSTLWILMRLCKDDELRQAICRELSTVRKICIYEVACEECPFYSRENYELLRSTLFPEEVK